MPELVVHSSATEEWLSLVHEAEAAAAYHLDEEMESYLVFLLMRFTERPELASSVLAVEYLQSMLSTGHIAQDQLRDVGDKCLLYSGLFPQRAERRRIKISYFVDLGRSAYQQLSARMEHGAAIMYYRLADTFVSLMDVLQAMRSLGNPDDRLDPLQAFELWQDTGSRHALNTLHKSTRSTPLVLATPTHKQSH
jgi:hypothetical protein